MSQTSTPHVFKSTVRHRGPVTFEGGVIGMRPAADLFVDGNQGDDDANGSAWSRSMRTMAAAFAVVRSGATIYWRGNIREQINTPAGVFDVSVVGVPTRARHADAHSTNGGYSASTWKLPAVPTADTPLVRVRQQGWSFINGLFVPGAAQVAIDVFRDGGAADLERDGSHCWIQGVRFDGAGIGIRANGGPAFVGIEDCRFRGMTTGIANITGAGIGTNLGWEIIDNRFMDNTNHLVVPLSQAMILRNVFGKFTTKSIDLVGGVGNNEVHGNYLAGDYDGYVAAANDEWAGNYSMDVASAEVGAEGLTILAPAA